MTKGAVAWIGIVVLGAAGLLRRAERIGNERGNPPFARETTVVRQEAGATSPTLPTDDSKLALRLEADDVAQTILDASIQNGPTLILESLDEADAESRRVILRAHINQLLSSEDPASASTWIDKLPECADRNALAARVGEAWTRTDPRAAWEWGRTLEGETKSIVIQAVLSTWATVAPIDAATAALRELPSSDRASGVHAVLLSWVQTDPAVAADWVSQFPESPLRETAVQNVVGNWARRDLDSAGQWLAGLPEGTSREAGLLTWSSLQSTSVNN